MERVLEITLAAVMFETRLAHRLVPHATWQVIETDLDLAQVMVKAHTAVLGKENLLSAMDHAHQMGGRAIDRLREDGYW